MCKNIFIYITLFLIIFLTACNGSKQQVVGKVFTSPYEYKVISQIPFYPDDTNLCGPATLAAVMAYNGRETTVEEATENIFRKKIKGSLAPDMVIWARKMGFKATFLQGTPEFLVEKIDKREPVIVQIDVGVSLIKKGHFAVVVGYGPDGIIVNSGTYKQLVIPWNEFLSTWLRASNLTIVVEKEKTQEKIEEELRLKEEYKKLDEKLKMVPKIEPEI